MVSLFGLFGGSSSSSTQQPGTPTRLPSYFPVQPKGCEKVSEALFACVTDTATARARDMEKAGFYPRYFEETKSEEQRVPTSSVTNPTATVVTTSTVMDTTSSNDDNNDLPRPGENPLDMCRMDIEKYSKCCNRELKKKKNWILTEPYRVQEEYRYSTDE